jgi:hypothetical protein
VTSSSPPELFNLLPYHDTRNDTHDAQTPEPPYQTSLQLRQVSDCLAIGSVIVVTNHSSRLQNSIGPSTITPEHLAPPEVQRIVSAVPQPLSAHGQSIQPSSSNASFVSLKICRRHIVLARALYRATLSYSSRTLPFASHDARHPLSDSSSKRQSACRTRSRPTWLRRTPS